MSSEIDLFYDYMKAQKNTQFGKPAADHEITEFEARYGVKLPADVKEYMLKINGVYVTYGFITLEALSDWGLMTEYKYYRPEYLSEKVGEPEKYFRFGGYDTLVWNWLIKLDANPDTETPVYALYEDIIKIADNFSDFLQKYRVHEPESLLGY